MELKPNFTQIPNIFLDKYIKGVKPSHHVVLMVICRKIYGWHKKQDRISTSQLVELTGYDKNTIREALRYWIGVGVLKKSKSSTNQNGTLFKIEIHTNLLNENLEVKNSSEVGENFIQERVKNSSQEGEKFTPQNKLQNKENKVSVNKEETIKTEIVKIDRHTEYLVNNLPRSELRQDSITNRINEFMMKLWKQYYQLPYKADLFETDRLAHELDHDWNSFLTLVKAFQTDQYWAKVSMSPRMLRKAWDTLGSRAKVSENAEREKYTNYREHYEQQLMEHEANKKQLKQTANNWKPWNIKEELSKMENKK